MRAPSPPDRAAREPRRRLLLAARVGAGMALLALVVGQAGLAPVLTAIAAADRRLLLLALAFVPPVVMLRVVRWSLLLRGQGIVLPWSLLLRALLLGVLAGQVLPTELAGDATRALATRRAGAATRTAVGSVLADRLLGAWALLATTVIGLAGGSFTARIGLPDWSWAPALALLLLATAAMAALGRAPLLEERADRGRLRHAIGAAAQTIHAFAERRLALLAAAVLALVGKLLIAVQVGVLARSLGAPIGAADAMVLAPAASFAAALPVTLGGIGVREASWALAFVRYGEPAAGGVALAWLLYGLLLLEGVSGGLLALVTSGRWRLGRPAEAGGDTAGELGSAR